MKAKIELIQHLEKARAPKYLHRVIWKWAQFACDRNVKFVGSLSQASGVDELVERHAITYRTQALPTASASYFTGPAAKQRDLPVGDYSYAMAA